MKKLLASFLLVCASLSSYASTASASSLAEGEGNSPTSALNPVIQWSKTLLVIVRRPGAQPATMHSTRSFAIMRAAIYDAVNAIDLRHKPYLVTLPDVPPNASQEAAAAAAAHEVLVALYPAFKASLDAALQQSLGQVADSMGKTPGIALGLAVADRILELRSNDRAKAPPILYIFGTAPGDYQSTPPNFPPQPQLTQWRHVTPFALSRANQFHPGPPPKLTGDEYTDCRGD